MLYKRQISQQSLNAIQITLILSYNTTIRALKRKIELAIKHDLISNRANKYHELNTKLKFTSLTSILIVY